MIPLDLPPPKLWLPPKPAIIRAARELAKATFPFPVFVPAAAPVLTTLSQVASATSTAQTVTGPAGIQAGDLLVLWDHANDLGGSIPATAVPTNFNVISNTTVGGEARTILSYKIATGAEASASLSGMVGEDNTQKALYVFRGDIPISVATPADSASESTDGNPAAQTVNASGGTPPLVVIAGYATRNAGAVDPRTFTVGGSPAKDGEINPNTQLYLAYKIYNTAPADVVADMDDEGQRNTLHSCYIACS